ncbi:MAG: hypothetical protein JXA25_06800 [Anaerolineales bacterium]|nr:hypothetical protein [Anaerolineales bacterium]
MPTTGASGIPFLVAIGKWDNSTRVENAIGYVSLLEAAGNPVEFYLIKMTGHSLSRNHKELTIDMFLRTVGMPY